MDTFLHLFSSVVILLLIVVNCLERRLNNKMRDQNHQNIMKMARSLSVYCAAKEGDLDTARLMAVVKREAERTKPPVSAGAKEEPTGVVFTEGVM
jgi:hypothetical protein